MRLACTGQWPNKPAEIASDEAAMRYRCSWKDLKDMALWTVLTHDACGMVYFVLKHPNIWHEGRCGCVGKGAGARGGVGACMLSACAGRCADAGAGAV